MIEVKNIDLVLGDRQILKSVNLVLEEGKIYGLTGNNGSGKTMLMKVICGLVKPTHGEVISDGLIIGRDCDYLNDAGVIIENPGFLPYYSGIKNLMLLAGVKKKADRKKVEETMSECGLNPKLKLHVGKYSLGMKQRLGIAQAIMENPKILILDEPMNGLDRSGVEEIRKLILEQKKEGHIILLASHNSDDIKILCDLVYVMEAGELSLVR